LTQVDFLNLPCGTKCGSYFSAGPKGGINLNEYVGDSPHVWTDPLGLDFSSIDPMEIRACEEARRKRLNQEFAASVAKLKKQLNKCCSSLRGRAKAKCQKEIDKIIAGLENAYQDIYDRGGPSFLSFNGPVCVECEEAVCKNMPSSARGAIGSCFAYDTVTHIGPKIPFFDISVPTRDHAWGEITCEATGQVITIDFWVGGTDFWRLGPDCFGWKRTSRPPASPAVPPLAPEPEPGLQPPGFPDPFGFPWIQ
jgi:hypothetical protein